MKGKTKIELLSKYVDGAEKKNKSKQLVNNVKVVDEEQAVSNSEESEQESDQRLPERIDSDDEEKGRQQEILSKDERLKKKFREALGIDNDEEVDDFLNGQLVIENEEGIDLKHLKNKKIKLTMDPNAAANIKTQYGDDQNVKLQQFLGRQPKTEPKKQISQEDSDVEVNRQALKPTKTIYRNKDGTIRQYTQEEERQMHRDAVMRRLGQWDKGMKQIDSQGKPKDKVTFGNTDIEDDYKIELAQREMFDDPMRQFQQKMVLPQKISLFKCPYDGPGNRFDIKPGHRWDGVVRGNGFEYQYIKNKNEKKDKHEEQLREYLQNL